MTKYIIILSNIITIFGISSCCFSNPKTLPNLHNTSNNTILRRSNALILTEEEVDKIYNMVQEIENTINEEKRTRRMIHAAIKFFTLIETSLTLAKEQINNFLGSDNTKDLIQCLNDYFALLKSTVMHLKKIQQKYSTQENYSKEDLKNAKEFLEFYREYLEKINNLFKNNGASLVSNINDENRCKIQNKLSLLCVTFETFLNSFINSSSNENIII